MKITTQILKPLIDEGFKVYNKDDFDVVGYVHNGAFHQIENPRPEHLEMRFSKFDKNGKCICRPMEKFFNWGDGLTEKFFPDMEISQNLSDWTIGCKYDGSLINPIVVNGELKFFTKMGESEVAKQFTDWFTKQISAYDLQKLKIIAETFTLNFEYISPYNKIVVDYKSSKAVILSARVIETGEYVDLKDLKELLKFLDKPEYPTFFTNYYPVDMLYDGGTLDECIAAIRSSKETEGEILINVKTGVRWKIKTDWYMERHGLVGIRFNFQNILAYDKRALIDLILLDRYDDIMADIEQDLIDEFLVKFTMFTDWLNAQSAIFGLYEERAKKLSKKEFAIQFAKHVPFGMSTLIFRTMDGEEIISDDLIGHFQRRFSAMKKEDVEIFWHDVIEKMNDAELGDHIKIHNAILSKAPTTPHSKVF